MHYDIQYDYSQTIGGETNDYVLTFRLDEDGNGGIQKLVILREDNPPDADRADDDTLIDLPLKDALACKGYGLIGDHDDYAIAHQPTIRQFLPVLKQVLDELPRTVEHFDGPATWTIHEKSSPALSKLQLSRPIEDKQILAGREAIGNFISAVKKDDENNQSSTLDMEEVGRFTQEALNEMAADMSRSIALPKRP